MVHLKMITRANGNLPWQMANFMFYMFYQPKRWGEKKKTVVVTWETDWKGEEDNKGMHLRWRRVLIKSSQTPHCVRNCFHRQKLRTQGQSEKKKKKTERYSKSELRERLFVLALN